MRRPRTQSTGALSAVQKIFAGEACLACAPKKQCNQSAIEKFRAKPRRRTTIRIKSSLQCWDPLLSLQRFNETKLCATPTSSRAIHRWAPPLQVKEPATVSNQNQNLRRQDHGRRTLTIPKAMRLPAYAQAISNLIPTFPTKIQARTQPPSSLRPFATVVKAGNG